MRHQDHAASRHPKDIADQEIMHHLALVSGLLAFLADRGVDLADAGMPEAEAYAAQLIASGSNSLATFQALRDYAQRCGHRSLYVALTELTDAHNALAVLADAIEAHHGREVRDQIFCEAPPPLGAGEAERCAYARDMTQRMAELLSPEEAQEAWFQVQHGIPAEDWHQMDVAERAKFEQLDDVDAYLALRRRERNAMLTQLRDEGALWYTQPITDEVLAFITSDPEMEGGRREGNRIFITKVPYDVAGYLAEPDPRLKRNHVCHCPMLREAIRQDLPISPDVCHCSLGHASHYYAALGVECKGEILESVAQGDAHCRFVFTMPEGAVDA